MTTILGDIILFFMSPVGFLLSAAMLMYFEYLVANSITKDIYGMDIKNLIDNYILHQALKPLHRIPPEQVAFEVMTRKKPIRVKELSNNK